MKSLAALVLLACAVQASAAAPPSPEKWIGAQPGVVVSVVPASSSGMFRATAYIIDTRGGQLIDSPSVEGPAGDKLFLEAKAEGMGHSTKASATINIADDGKSASYSASVERDGVVMRTETGTLQVPSPGV